MQVIAGVTHLWYKDALWRSICLCMLSVVQGYSLMLYGVLQKSDAWYKLPLVHSGAVWAPPSSQVHIIAGASYRWCKDVRWCSMNFSSSARYLWCKDALVQYGVPPYSQVISVLHLGATYL